MWVMIQSEEGYRIVDLNRRKAIRERCLNCSGWYPKEVENCTFTDCPLYFYRMGRGKQDPKSRERSIREYCLWCMAGNMTEVSKCPSTTCPLFPYRMTKPDRSAEVNGSGSPDKGKGGALEWA